MIKSKLPPRTGKNSEQELNGIVLLANWPIFLITNRDDIMETKQLQLTEFHRKFQIVYDSSSLKRYARKSTTICLKSAIS
jgi:hypothetical protein